MSAKSLDRKHTRSSETPACRSVTITEMALFVLEVAAVVVVSHVWKVARENFCAVMVYLSYPSRGSASRTLGAVPSGSTISAK